MSDSDRCNRELLSITEPDVVKSMSLILKSGSSIIRFSMPEEKRCGQRCLSRIVSPGMVKVSAHDMTFQAGVVVIY